MKNQPTELISTRIGNAYSDTLIDIRNLKEEIISLTDLIADAVVKKINPAKDEISERAACGLGKDTEISQRQAMDELKVSLSWLDEQVAKGLLSRRRKGKRKNSPIIYSRLEILALKQAERRAKLMVRQSLQNDEA